jgi:hypothetical protein
MSAELHIANLSEALFERISHDAVQNGLSPGEWAAKVLETHYLPLTSATRLPADTVAAVQRLFGSWDEDQKAAFSQVMAESDTIDQSIWK